MPKPALDRSAVVPLVGEGVAAGVPQHVGMGLELQAGTDRGALDHASEAGRGEGRAALAAATMAGIALRNFLARLAGQEAKS
jgi:hypothetical protein